MLYKCTEANTSAIWQQAAHTTDQLASPSCSTRAIQKSLSLNEKYLRVFWRKKSQENGPLAEKLQDRKSKRTRQKKQEEIPKWQPWDSRQEEDTSPASLQAYDALQYQAGSQKGWVVQKILCGQILDIMLRWFKYIYPTPPDLIMGA